MRFCQLALCLASSLWLVAASKKQKKLPKPVHRVQTHDKAYDKRPEWGERLNIKVTPPEGRGKSGKVLVEVYNFSKKHIQLVHFELLMFDKLRRYQMASEVQAEDLKPNGGGAKKWINIQVAGGKIPKIVKIRTRNMRILDANGRRVRLKHDTDLIKK